MKKLEDILFIVQAREGSTRIKNKMIRPFGNTNLLSNCLKTVKLSNIPHSQFYASVAEPNLVKISEDENVQIFSRSQESAQESQDVPLILEWHKMSYKYYIMISACCPFITATTINKFINQFILSKSKGMMSVIKKRNILWDDKENYLNQQHGKDFQTQTLSPYYEAAHCLYAGSMKRLKEDGIHMGTFTSLSDPAIFIMSEEEAFDIDELWQFNLASAFFSKQIK